jgi:hypothetical protein
MEETRVPRENYRPVTSQWQTLSLYVSFIDGGNRSTQRKLPTCHKSVTNFITICQFYWWRKPEYPEKTTDLSQVRDKLYHYTNSPYLSTGCYYKSILSLENVTLHCTLNILQQLLMSRDRIVIKFVTDLWQVGSFLWVLRFPPSIKLTYSDKVCHWLVTGR